MIYLSNSTNNVELSHVESTSPSTTFTISDGLCLFGDCCGPVSLPLMPSGDIFLPGRYCTLKSLPYFTKHVTARVEMICSIFQNQWILACLDAALSILVLRRATFHGF